MGRQRENDVTLPEVSFIHYGDIGYHDFTGARLVEYVVNLHTHTVITQSGQF